MPSTAPAAAAAAPAGIRPTSSEPATSTPRAQPPPRLDPRDDLVERRRLPVLDVHADLDEAGARQVEPERAHAGKAAAALPHDRGDRARDLDVVAPQVDVEGDQRPARADEHGTGGRIEPRRAEVGRELAGVDPALELLAARRAGRTPARAPVPPYRKTGRPSSPIRPATSQATPPAPAPCPPGATGTSGHDVGRADPRVRALVPAQVDPLARALDPGDERRRRAPASSPTSVNTERLWSASAWTSSSRARSAERRRRSRRSSPRSRPSEKFGTDSSGNTLRTLGSREGVLPRPRPRVRRLVARARPLRTEHRPGWQDERDRRSRAGSPPCRRSGPSTSPAAPASSRASSRGEVTGLDQSDAMLEVAARAGAGRRPSSRATRSTCRSTTARSTASSRATSTATSRRPSASASSPRRGASRPSSSSSTPALPGERAARRAAGARPHGRHATGTVYKRFFTPDDLLAELGGAPSSTRTAGSSLVAALDAAPGLVPLARLAPARQPRLPRVRRGRLPARVAARCSRGTPASAPTCTASRRGSSRAPSAARGAAVPARPSAAGSTWTRTTFYATFYCAVGHALLPRPGRIGPGRPDARRPREQELCAFWLEWELRLLRPELIVAVGGLAIRRLLGPAHSPTASARRSSAAARPSSRSRTPPASAAG